MMPTESDDFQPSFRQRLVDRLHNPAQLRAFITVLVVLGSYAGIYLPLQGQIDDATRRLAQKNDLLDLANGVEHLRAQHAGFQARLPAKSDSNEWVQYVLSGIRQFPLKMVEMGGGRLRDLGPYKAIVLRAEVEGSFSDLERFLCWLETNPRLLRVDSMRLAASRGGKGVLALQIVILGVMG